MKKALILLVLSFTLVFSACAPTATPTPQASAVAVNKAVNAQGHLEPQSSLSLSFNRAGQVAEVLVSEGQTVKAGDILARLGNTESIEAEYTRAQSEFENASLALKLLEDSVQVQLAQAELQIVVAEKQVQQAQDALDTLNEQTDPDALDLSEAQARLKLAQSTLEQNQRSLDELKVENNQLRPAQLRLQTAQATLAAAEAARRASELSAPVDGVAVDLRLKVGEFTAAGQPALSLVDFSAWVVKTDDLTELEVVKVKIGQTVSLRFDALPDLTLRGEVTTINIKFEERRGEVTYTVTIRVNDSNDLLRWGMTAAVQFEE
ncbi:MAG TPA: HlyD family efflux transporter periplasmic adaptor subunit [Anaerolineaceae bacterium]|nr:HlyD family efflux transporter periplasmic adaptor subunit [Anaerolineaceae bacterium]